MKTALALLVSLAVPPAALAAELTKLVSPDGSKAIVVDLSPEGDPTYTIHHRGSEALPGSPLGLITREQDFSTGLRLIDISRQEITGQRYTLISGNHTRIDTQLRTQTLTLENTSGAAILLDLAATNQGVAFRYRFPDGASRLVTLERSGFRLPESSTAWMQPYHAAGPYTPAYEDFYFEVKAGDQPPRSRETPRGWAMPVLVNLPESQGCLLIADTNVTPDYCAVHLRQDEDDAGLYRVELAYDDEGGSETAAQDATPEPVRTNTTPWRMVIVGDDARDIFNSTLATDLAATCELSDTSWIEPGRSSWSWWSHPDDPVTRPLLDRFTDVSAELGWEYTLFDAGWWQVDLRDACAYAESKGVKPLAWTSSGDFATPERTRRKLDELKASGVAGVKADFWCSDRQRAIASMFDLMREAGKRGMLVNLHGCTIPRGWHRTFPNLVTAEAVLGAESYFYESRYTKNAAELNTVLPFTRNVLGPMDQTPLALTQRKYPRTTTNAHELATSIVFTSGVIHFADSAGTLAGLPPQVKQILSEAPAQWEESECIIAEPGRCVCIARRTGATWYIAALNGTDTERPITLDLARYAQSGTLISITDRDKGLDWLISEQPIGPDPSSRVFRLAPRGGLVLRISPLAQ